MRRGRSGLFETLDSEDVLCESEVQLEAQNPAMRSGWKEQNTAVSPLFFTVGTRSVVLLVELESTAKSKWTLLERLASAFAATGSPRLNKEGLLSVEANGATFNIFLAQPFPADNQWSYDIGPLGVYRLSACQLEICKTITAPICEP